MHTPRLALLLLVVAPIACADADDGSGGWIEVTDVPERGGYYDVWAFGDEDVRLGTDQGQLLRFDGDGWAPESTPSSAPIVGLWGLPPNILWACSGTSVMRHDGTSWRVMADTAALGLRSTTGIWASSDTDVWVVGDDAIAVHWDGSTATASSLPDQSPSAIFGTGPADVWIAGTFSVAHYDGNTWSTIDDDALSFGASGIWGSGPDDVWFADDSELVHWDGSTFERVEPDGWFIGDATALWGFAPDDIWSVGSAGSIAHYDGRRWEELDHQAIGSPQLRQLSAVHGTSSSNVWAVGTVLDDRGATGIVHRRP